MKNKLIIVTGGASGIGKAICEEYAKIGWTILIIDINIDAGQTLKNDLSKITTAFFYSCDFSNPDSIRKVSESIASEHLILDVIIHNARAQYTTSKIKDNINNELDRDFNIFIKSPLLLSELLIENLSRSSNPCITYIGSTNSTFISHQPLSYHVCKGALMQVVRYLAVKLGPLNIRVNVVNPGIVDIPGRIRKNLGLFSRAVKAVIPLGRTAFAHEVANICIFLSSEQARYMTGSTIDLDGGEHLKDHFSLAYKILENRED